MSFFPAKIKAASALAGALLCTLAVSTESVVAAPMSASLSLTPRIQEMTNWCWAASSTAVLGYKKKSVSQTQFVTYVKGSAVNQTASYAEDQKGLSHWGLTSSFSGTFSYSTLTAEIYTYSRPVMVGWQWKAGGGHIVVATGYSSNGVDRFVEYMDPKDGRTYSIELSYLLGSATDANRSADGMIYQIQ